jgi:hypothetical protein
MKRILLFLVLVSITTNGIAQLPVETTTQTKKIAFEEFTGIYCSGCPGGHLISDGLKNTYPDDFFPIYIHDSPFADPRLPSDPNYKTVHGAALLSALGTGYVPVASINRKIYEGGVMGLDKATWAAWVDSALLENAYVNVALEATVNILTRELVVNSEIYFTGSSAPPTMKYNLSIAQNNVEGPQKSSYNNPSAVLPNGNYLHQHQFKEFVTGQWGEDITTTSMGTLVSRVDTHNLPLYYNGVTFELYDLEVVGFIAEGTTDVINANKCEITYIVPPSVNLVDLSIKSNTIITSDLCDSTFTPTVTVYNTGSIAVDSMEVITDLNGVLLPGEQFYQTIMPGDSAVLTLSPITISDKINSAKYLINTHNYNTYYDTVSSNNYTVPDYIYHIPASSVASTYEAGFEYTSLSVSMPNSYMINTNPNGKFVALTENNFSTASQPIGGFGNSTKSMWIGAQFYSQPEFVEITIGKLDLSSIIASNFEFSYSSQLLQNSSNVKLEFKVSNDCGLTWSSVWLKQGAALANVSGLYSGIIFTPEPGDWSREIIDLSNYDGDDNVIIRMEFTPDPTTYTNAGIFMDDFLLSSAAGLSDLNSQTAFSLHPNPAKELLNIVCGSVQKQKGEIEILNSLGMVVQRNMLAANTNKSLLDISKLSNGVYFVKLIVGSSSSVQKLIIE